MKKYLITMIVTMLLVLSGCKKDIKDYEFTPYVTRGNKTLLLAEQLSFKTGESEKSVNQITINTKSKFQEIDGFGAAMSESSGYVISNLDEATKDALMADLFSSEGIGMDFVRIPMGASDFALDNYTYNDSDTADLTLSKFTLERDLAYVIPRLQEAVALNPDLKLMGSPWSAPAWMKNNNKLNGGYLLPTYYAAYADYFVKFIEGYQANGLDMYAITVQNEPLHETSSYPSMHMSVSEQINFVSVLGPKFEDASIDTKIIGYDHNWDNQFYPQALLDNEKTKDFIDGVAFHCYNGSVADQKAFYDKNPDANIYFTECTGIATYRNFSDNMTWNMENIFIGAINAGAKTALLWNLALDEAYGPQNGGCGNCVGVVTVKEDGYQLNEEYYAIGHFSKFLDAGARRIEATTTNLNLLVSAFINPDGSVVSVIHNKSAYDQYIELAVDGRTTNYVVEAKSTVTLDGVQIG